MAKNTNFSDGQFWADKLMDLANLMAAILIFGQFTSSNPRPEIAIAGLVIYLLFVVVSKRMRKGTKK